MCTVQVFKMKITQIAKLYNVWFFNQYQESPVNGK